MRSRVAVNAINNQLSCKELRSRQNLIFATIWPTLSRIFFYCLTICAIIAAGTTIYRGRIRRLRCDMHNTNDRNRTQIAVHFI